MTISLQKMLLLLVIALVLSTVTVVDGQVMSSNDGSGDSGSISPSGTVTSAPTPSSTPTFTPGRFVACAFQAQLSSGMFNQSLFVSQCVTRINAVCSSNPVDYCGSVTRFTLTDLQVSIVVADVTGGGSLPSSFPLASAFPFQLPTVRVNPTFIVLVNFLYPSGASSETILPLAPTLEAVRSASQDFASAARFNVEFVNGIDLTIFYKNRLIIFIAAPVGGALLCLALLAVIIGIVICYKKKHNKKGKVAPHQRKERQASVTSNVSDIMILRK